MKQKKEIVIQAEAPSSELGVCPDTLSGKGSHRLNDNDRLRALILKATTIWISRQRSLGSVSGHKGITFAEAPNPRPRNNKSACKVLESLSRLGSAKPCDIAGHSGLSLPTVQRSLKKLLAADQVTKSGRTQGVRYALLKT